MQKSRQNPLDHPKHGAKRYVTHRTQQADIDGKVERINHARTESAPYKPDSAEHASGRVALGETHMMLETAETMKQTSIEQEQTVDFEGMPIESVRDFPTEAIVTAFHQPNQVQAQSALTSSSIDHLYAAMQEQQTRHLGSSKDFIHANSRTIKTIKELQAEKVQARKKREQDVQARRSSNPWGYKFFGLKDVNRESQLNFQTVYRSQDWNKIAFLNGMENRQPNQSSGFKNITTNQAFQEVEVREMAEANEFSRNKKEQAWLKTNQSSINMLRSFRTLDFESKDEENDLVGETLGSVVLAQNLNRCSQLDQPSHGRQPQVPESYQSFLPREEIIHNLRNTQVQSARLRNYRSSIISDM